MSFRFASSIAAATAILALGSAAALADDRIPAEALSPAYVVHKLAADGHELRSIEFKDGAYRVDVATGDGRTYRATVDPADASLNPHAFVGRGLRADQAPAGSLSSSIIVQLVDAAGYPDLVELEMKNGMWKVEAQDATGRKAKLWADPVTGAIAGPGQIARN